MGLTSHALGYLTCFVQVLLELWERVRKRGTLNRIITQTSSISAVSSSILRQYYTAVKRDGSKEHVYEAPEGRAPCSLRSSKVLLVDLEG